MYNDTISLRQMVFKYLDNHPIATNSDVYKAFPGESENSLRQYRKQYFDNLKEEIDLDTGKGSLESLGRDNTFVLQDQNEKIYTKIDSDTIEKSLLKLLNAGHLDTKLVREMINYYVKVKEGGEGLDEEIDMEGFLKVDIGRDKDIDILKEREDDEKV